jgi:hypothetical protein
MLLVLPGTRILGPDLVVPIQEAVPDAGQLPDSVFLLGFASKQGTTSWGDIKEEVEKGLKVPIENRALAGKLRAVLVDERDQ